MSVRSALVELSDISLPPRPPAPSWPDVTTPAGPSALIAALMPHAERPSEGSRRELTSLQRAEQLGQGGRAGDPGCHVTPEGPHFGFGVPRVRGETQLPPRAAPWRCP